MPGDAPGLVPVAGGGLPGRVRGGGDVVAMTRATRLHAAATRLRALAEAASEWNADLVPGSSLHLWVIDHDPSDPTGQTPMQRLVGGADAPWGDYIAALAPPVALAVADWLDLAASHVPYPEGGMGFVDGEGYTSIDPACGACGTPDEYAVPWPCATYEAALAVADAINEGDH